LKDINAVVLTESTARKFFNSIDVVGKMFTMDADPSFEKLGTSLVVSGVMEDPPGNSSLRFDVLFTFGFMRLSFEDDNWLNAYLGTFVVLYPGANLPAVIEKFNAVYAVHAKEQLGKPNQDLYGFDPQIKYGLQPMTDIHLNSEIQTNGFNEGNEGGVINSSSPVYSYLFMGIAVFVLFMAVINFINISIATSLKRTKEVGVRKISGGSSGQIIVQFLLESSLLCMVAFLLSIVLMVLMLPLFNTVTGKQLLFVNAMDWKLSGYYVVVQVVIILLTGFYPAFVLSHFKAHEVLYNKQKLNSRNLFGGGLIVLQFSLAVFLLVASMVYYSQMNYIRTKDLGYNPHNIIRTEVYGNRDYKPVINVLKNELGKESSIKAVSFGSDGHFEDMKANDHSFKAMNRNIDENYLSLMEIPLVEGRNLSPDFANGDKDGVLVNEAFVKSAGWQQPIGQAVLIDRHYDSLRKTVVGVVKDYHFGSLREPIKPMMMYMNETPDGGIWVKFDKTNQKAAMAALKRIYEEAMPKAIYQYSFMDELNAREYMKEQRWQTVVNFATVLAFTLCCVGLLGLAHLAASQRYKEIGIRKVLGASVSQVVSLLTSDFLKLVMLSMIVAFPVAWVVMNRWLQDYAYRVEVSWRIFFGAATTALLISLLTVGLQAVKAAMANPVNSLRKE